ncbi:GNAT family N-acetyltransferase [Isoptericola dokdonensis]|uniref:BioF2-like acetyltransferase domain-containing protein n=1 Tax=Isoptericola dokdonensis DS-3 TaxID=1300344 RepID=A0A168FY80_9MICO|nr:GNAT family N-acetyltransferase [Isoptericola dokdonensis]ANC32719.1 hypothetical protein I598_3209 [Isoptericola dokdonensis DS-3]
MRSTTTTSSRAATTARTLAIEDVDADDAARWADLAGRALEPNPFLHPDFVLAARRTFPPRESGRPFPSAFGLRLVVVERDGRWLALLPLSPTRRFDGTPFPFATTAGPFVGTRAPVCAPLVDASDATAALDALLTHLGSGSSDVPGLLELTLLPDGPLAALMRERAAARGVAVRERSRFERACWTASPDPWRTRVSGSRRSKLKRWTAAIERDAGPLAVRDAGGDPAALTRVLELESAGWKGDRTRRGSALRIIPGAEEWIQDVARAFSAREQLHVYLVEAGDRLVYGALCLGSGDGVFGVLDAYDDDLSAHSPGSVGRALVLDHVEATESVRLFDPCMHPRYAVATGVYPDRRDVVGFLIATRTTSRALLACAGPLTAARNAVRAARDRAGRRRGADDEPRAGRGAVS